MNSDPAGQDSDHRNYSNVCSQRWNGFSCRHTDDMIHKLELAGLGYHVKTEESDDRLGMNSIFQNVSSRSWAAIFKQLIQKVTELNLT